jgi:hypothetical protein
MLQAPLPLIAPAGVVDEDVARTRCEDFADRPLDCGQIGDIDGLDLGVSAACRDLCSELAERLGVTRDEDDAMPESRELEGRLATNAARGAGEEDTTRLGENVCCHGPDDADRWRAALLTRCGPLLPSCDPVEWCTTPAA